MIIYSNPTKLNQKLLRELFDYRNGSLYWKIKPAATVNVGDVVGYLSDRYYRCCILSKGYAVHRIIFLYHHGYLPEEVDHINGITTDNRIDNLRVSTRNENIYNTKKPKSNTSGIKGVSWDKRQNRWVAYCSVGGKRFQIGYYKNLEDAEKVVREFREKHHGEFVNHG